MSSRLRTIGRKLDPPRRVKVRPAPKVADPFYSAEWRALVEAIIATRGRRCEDPTHDAALPRDGIRIFGDHIRELRDGGAPLDPANVMLRCGACHARKTVTARAQRYGREWGV